MGIVALAGLAALSFTSLSDPAGAQDSNGGGAEVRGAPPGFGIFTDGAIYLTTDVFDRPETRRGGSDAGHMQYGFDFPLSPAARAFAPVTGAQTTLTPRTVAQEASVQHASPLLSGIQLVYFVEGDVYENNQLLPHVIGPRRDAFHELELWRRSSTNITHFRVDGMLEHADIDIVRINLEYDASLRIFGLELLGGNTWDGDDAEDDYALEVYDDWRIFGDNPTANLLAECPLCWHDSTGLRDTTITHNDRHSGRVTDPGEFAIDLPLLAAGTYYIAGYSPTRRATALPPPQGTDTRPALGRHQYRIVAGLPDITPPAPGPGQEGRDFSPFRFNIQSFNAFLDSADIQNDDCVSGGALTDLYGLGPFNHCRFAGNGTLPGEGWQFVLPGDEAARVERTVQAGEPGQGSRVATKGYQLSLLVTGGRDAADAVAPSFAVDVGLESVGDGIGIASFFLDPKGLDNAPDPAFGFTPGGGTDGANIAARTASTPVTLAGGASLGDCLDGTVTMEDGAEVCDRLFREFVELNFADHAYHDQVLEHVPVGTQNVAPIDSLPLERIRLTAFEIWTEVNAPQSFEIRALQAEKQAGVHSLRDPSATRALTTTTDGLQPCAPLAGPDGTHTGGGFCQSFSVDLVSHVGRFLIVGTQEATTPESNVGVRLRSFTYEAQTILPPSLVTDREAEQDLAPFRFDRDNFDAFIAAGDPQRDDCVSGGALTATYLLPEADQCRAGGQGRGWTFLLPGAGATRLERTVTPGAGEGAAGEVATTRYGLSLTVTGGGRVRNRDEVAPLGRRTHYVLIADDERGLGFRSEGDPFLGNDSPNLVTRGPRSVGEPIVEFLELNFSEYEEFSETFGTDEIAATDPIDPIAKTLSLERIELTGIEIWTATATPQRFQIRALADEEPTTTVDLGATRTTRLNDPVVTQLDFRTDNAQPCTPLDGSAGTSPGWCQSFSLSLVSHVGRFLIVGTQMAEFADLTSGIRLRSIQYQFQTAMGLPLPGGLVLALTGLAGLGGIALRRRVKRSAGQDSSLRA